ncbi:DUF2141 domain-containing protein [uncultured Vibrio sp.]|uniref:DUF2141 domain-containing protein n=1 Tax=uncultured Vibrio sp. TaxID=114054 RepID=UPI0025EBC9E9|nr:DUF2141 domain-containing protein [uncultured Vibrio sp.]
MTTALGSFASEITVTGIEHDRGGNIIVFVFSEDGFPKKHDLAIQQQTQKAKADTMQFLFDMSEVELNKGEVAIKVLHDEDENGQVTKNWTGIYPAEGLGFSKQQKVTLTGAPVYKHSKIDVTELASGLTIEMNYP